MKILLIGMWGFYNRGCEAIVWGSRKILKEIFPNAEVAVAVGYPENASIDRERLPTIGLEIYPLVSANQPKSSILSRLFRRAFYQVTGSVRLYKYRKPIGYPEKGWDLVLEVGGDTYADNPLLKFQYDQWLMQEKGLNVGLWGMNLGPYSNKLISKAKQKNGFSQYNFITVRDKFSKRYLADIGVEKNVHLMADPAFEMDPEPWEAEPFLPMKSERGIIGINLNPSAVQIARKGIEEIVKMLQDAARVLIEKGFGVLLVPHCFPPACPLHDDDTVILRPAFQQLREEGLNIGMLPNGLNSPQVKYAISQCTLFTGIRMHSTIAAWSTNVPVLTISYSQKSLNHNDEIYGHQEYVLDIASLTSEKLVGTLLRMAKDIDSIKKATTQGVARLRRHTRDMIFDIKTPLE